MTLPTGTISMSQVRTEYGFGNPVSLSQARGKPGAPASGTISMGQLRGLSNLSFSFSSSGDLSQSGNDFITNDTSGQGYCEFTITSTQVCVWTYSITGGAAGGARQSATPANNGSANYWRATVNGAPQGQTGNVSTTRTNWKVTATYGGQSTTWTVSVGTNGGGVGV